MSMSKVQPRVPRGAVAKRSRAATPRLRPNKRVLRNKPFTVAITGTHATGKSTLLNARVMDAGTSGPDVTAIRALLHVNQATFARLIGASIRSVAAWEAGAKPNEQAVRRLMEIRRLHESLCRIMKPESVGKWLEAPNSAFDELKPIEVIERGELDRIWTMIFLLQSGAPA